MTKAFTLIEVVVTVGMFLVMLLVLVQFYVNSNSQFVYERSYVEVARGADDIVASVSSYVLPANQVLALHTFSSDSYQSTTTTLVLELPSITSSGTIITGAYDYVAFYQSGSRVYRLIEANAASSRRSGTRMLSESVSVLAFTYDSTDFSQVREVTVSVDTAATAKEQLLEHSLSQRLYLRNAPSL